MFNLSSPFDRLRQMRILGGSPQQSPLAPRPAPQRFGMMSPQEPAQAPQQPGSYEDDIMNLMNTSGPALQAYRDYISRLPQREDYKPGVMTRIAAALSGFGAGLRSPEEGVRVASDINSSRFRNTMTDYANEGVGLKEQADIEQGELAQKIRALQAARALGLKYDEFHLKQLESQNRMQNDTTTANAAMTRAQAYADRQSRPGYHYFPQADGSVLQVGDDGSRTEIPANTVEAENTRLRGRELGNSVRRTNIYDRSVSDRARHDRAMENRPTAASRPPTPQVQQDATDNALREMMTDPIFSDYIELDKNGFPMPVEDDGSEDYQDFLQALDAKVDAILKGTNRRYRGGR